MPDRLTIAATTHGRVLVKHPSTPGPWPAIVGFHGYGQNASHILADLERLPHSDRWLLVGVQGLHRFYAPDQKTVVASWMTSEDRELAIPDNVRYVMDVVDALRHAWPFTRLVYAGFSQGVAMAFRAAMRGGVACDGVVALGGDIPPELLTETAARWPPVVIGRGHSDRLYSAEQFARDVHFLSARGALSASVTFAGGHEWADAFRERAAAFLEAQRVRTE